MRGIKLMHDILDILNPKQQYTGKGNYYNRRPIAPDDGAISFNYEYVNPYSATYQTLWGNVQSSDGIVTIRTNDQLNFFIREESGEFGWAVLQDGKSYIIEEVAKDYQKANRQVLRLFGTPVSTDYLLRLKRVDNPWLVT